MDWSQVASFAIKKTYDTYTPIIVKTSSGKEYTYKTKLNLKVGDVVVCPDAGTGTFCAMVQKINVCSYFGKLKVIDTYLFNINLITYNRDHFIQEKAQNLCLELLTDIHTFDRHDIETIEKVYPDYFPNRYQDWNIKQKHKDFLFKSIFSCFGEFFPDGIEHVQRMIVEDKYEWSIEDDYN